MEELYCDSQVQDCWNAYLLLIDTFLPKKGFIGCLPFIWKTRKFQLENQMVRIIPFGVLLKLWASGQSDAFLLLHLGFTADVHTICMLSIFC